MIKIENKKSGQVPSSSSDFHEYLDSLWRPVTYTPINGVRGLWKDLTRTPSCIQISPFCKRDSRILYVTLISHLNGCKQIDCCSCPIYRPIEFRVYSQNRRPNDELLLSILYVPIERLVINGIHDRRSRSQPSNTTGGTVWRI